MKSDVRREFVASQVARILREEREQRGLSMSTVAERAGLSHQMIGYVERELRSPTLDTLLRITEAIGIDVAEVLAKAQRGKTTR